jgi:hypothetical protein
MTLRPFEMLAQSLPQGSMESVGAGQHRVGEGFNVLNADTTVDHQELSSLTFKLTTTINAQRVHEFLGARFPQLLEDVFHGWGNGFTLVALQRSSYGKPRRFVQHGEDCCVALVD